MFFFFVLGCWVFVYNVISIPYNFTNVHMATDFEKTLGGFLFSSTTSLHYFVLKFNILDFTAYIPILKKVETMYNF